MDQPKDFRSTVLQAPSRHDGEDRERRHDLSSIVAPPPPPPPGPSGFSLRSPGTSSDFQHPHHASAYHSSPPHDHRSPPRQHAQPAGLSHPTIPYSGSSGGTTLPALQQPSSSSSATASHHPPPLSPLHPPSGTYYPPPDPREKPSHHHGVGAPPPSSASKPGSYYDPLTDSTRERRVSDAASRTSYPSVVASSQPASPPKPRDPYGYPPSTDQHDRSHHSYYSGHNYNTSPVRSSFAQRSPVSRSNPDPAIGSTSPSRRFVSPGASNGASIMSRSEKSPLKAPAASTPSRAADPMSFSNILSSSEPVSKPRSPPPVKDTTPAVEVGTPSEPITKPEREPEQLGDPDAESTPRPTAREKRDKERDSTPVLKEKRKVVRKSKSRASDIRDEATPKIARRASSSLAGRETPTPRVPAKRQANGQPKQKSLSAENEKKVQAQISKLDSRTDELDASELHVEESLFLQHGRKRRRLMTEIEYQQNERRRHHAGMQLMARLATIVDAGKRRYDELFYEEALHEVRDREIFAEKERKKDMQRKRRREKSMAVTMEAKNAALRKAETAEDEAERIKYLREADRANKKAQQTKMILQKGIKGPARHVEINLDGGTMSTFAVSDMEHGGSTSKKGKGRTGTRLKKSKEQKQAEKDSAEAAQAALDAGEELPSKEESKIRIKINKSKGKDKDGNKDEEKKEKKEKKATKKSLAAAAAAAAAAAVENGDLDGDADEGDKENADIPEPVTKPSKKAKEEKVVDPDARFHTKGYIQIYDQIWRDLARKDVSKTFKLAAESYQTKASNLKKTAILASKEAKRWQLRTNKGTKDQQARAKRVMRDMMGFWKRNEREERDLRKAAEKQELENARKEEADREAARQKRKLNFLISQTELYSHFIGKKIKTAEVERSTDNPEIAPEHKEPAQDEGAMDIDEPDKVGGKVTNFENLDFDNEDETALRQAAMANAQNAIAEAQRKARAFNEEDTGMDEEGEMNFQNPTGLGDVEIAQPKLINAQLKEYQLKGLNWLANLYEQGINGILADEMGLGKTVQSISVMAYLAEKYDIWGPFLVVAPASTLHNWEQEIRKFVPEFKILPYWGTAGDRKVLRKFWDRKHTTYRKEANFHVCVTSYQLVVSDVAYFQKMRWQYMILDEAQAIKSSSSSRWKSLLNFHCRNRLLLTGTPIQNNMQELWALLHFIMPSLFDSHDEFSEWFSKDIESHAQSNTKLNEDQLKRLHMILKPFMLRRVKKHVQKELGDKIEKDIFCDLTYRQRAYYSNLRNQISIMDLIEKATTGDDNDSGTLMNLVMQFRKVCNHPDLFERADTMSPMSFGYFAETASFIREGTNVDVGYSTRNLIEYDLPRLVWEEGGRLYKAGHDNSKAGWRNKALQHMLNVWTPENMRESTSDNGAFSWLRFADTSAGEVSRIAHQGLFARAAELARKRDRLGPISVAYDDPEDDNFTPAHAMFQITARNDRKPLADITEHGVLARLMNVASADYNDSGLGRLEQAGKPKVTAPPIEVACNSPGTTAERAEVLFNVAVRKTLYGPTPVEQKALIEQKLPLERFPSGALLPAPDNEKKKFTNIVVPSMGRFVTDSGKLAKLDELLFTLKNEGHRVLLYFQMTRMIDLMEEYLTYRNYKYCRLDGSTKLEDRRDTVADFQTRPEIFIFLLSTRAGGLGINLTSADTVIFYDSDWNPTIDSQAMDRAHRLGQTRQVTVYRLITRGTIEERIRKRALQKEEVQRVVIQGGGASVDFSGRRAPENRNRDIAMWLADDDQAELIEQREKEMLESGEFDKAPPKKKPGKRKRAEPVNSSLDEMYHEGEGNFDDKQASGTATPVAPEAEASNAKGAKKRRVAGGKKAKTLKQRLALADGNV